MPKAQEISSKVIMESGMNKVQVLLFGLKRSQDAAMASRNSLECPRFPKPQKKSTQNARRATSGPIPFIFSIIPILGSCAVGITSGAVYPPTKDCYPALREDHPSHSLHSRTIQVSFAHSAAARRGSHPRNQNSFVICLFSR